jgi:heat shock protein HslJ
MNRTSPAGWTSATLCLAVIAGCSQQGPSTPAPAVAAGPPPAPTLEQLKSATVSGLLPQPVTLADGVYQGEPAEPGAASRPVVNLWAPSVVFADVDGAPGNEAVAMLSSSGGGSGTFVHLAVFASKDGKAQSVATAQVGDRVRLVRLWVEHGEIHMDVVEPGPKDPSCCPTQLSRKTWKLEGGALKLASNDVVGVVSVNLLASTDWMLASMDGKPVDPAQKPPTLLVQYGKVVGFDGCNRYSGALKESAPGEISVGPLAATKMACPPEAMTLSDEFTKRMNKVTGYTFDAGQLALTWQEKGQGGVLVFAK